jgi:hypothetical protein
MNHRVSNRIEAVVGVHVWSFADFITTSASMRVGGNKKGVLGRDSQPKAGRPRAEATVGEDICSSADSHSARNVVVI